MTKPRTRLTPLLSLGFLLFVCLSSPSLRAQQSTTTNDDRARGIDLYKQGNDQEAIAVLRQVVNQDKGDVGAWHYLGLAYNRQGKTSDALKAHERSAKAGEALLMNQIESIGDGDISVNLSLLKPQFDEAADSADKYLELSSKLSGKKAEEWRQRAAFLREMASSSPPNESLKNGIYSMKEVSVKARILNRGLPMYTERARQNGVRGTVVLRMILGSDGKVRVVKIVRGLPDGLTAEAIRAAQRTKFIPAIKDGQPVSQFVQMEFNFNIY